MTRRDSANRKSIEPSSASPMKQHGARKFGRLGELWIPPSVSFMDGLDDHVRKLAIFRPTAPPQTGMSLCDAINILVDVRRLLPSAPMEVVNRALSEAQGVATLFLARWVNTPQLECQLREVQTMAAPARSYWRVKLSVLASLKRFSHYLADEVTIMLVSNGGEIITVPWNSVVEWVEELELTIVPAPSNTPCEVEAHPDLLTPSSA
ncbi:hypothetical protein LTR96_011167 [Exophiala xenobiotica]|nr:hypothetical protein LTR72_011538 [Exophiala xenobiotica]KAK5263429.1 hypothetical protein LTR96_011167 [Exophiala xenobiotica]KAK5285128.1 hypothetical protein LTR14_011216 [Exophiala xenobiotica]KAK5332555.1 hypothetical protein LTR98_011316 [Exophiala xenobiotica]KAK5468961.1 hypothetical protein LTR55_011504 [Exophiala xenobiotica]